MAYIALKPIRFDRNYAISEIIPEGVVDPAMAKKHIDGGRIAHIPDKAPLPGGAEVDPNTGEPRTGDTLPADTENGLPSESGTGGEPDTPNANETDDHPPDNTETTEPVAAKKSHKK